MGRSVDVTKKGTDEKDIIKKNNDHAIRENKDNLKEFLRHSFVLDKESGRLNQRLTCVVCDKSFSKLWNARSHVRIHFDAKAFKCKCCDYSSVQKGNLLMHMKKGVCKRAGIRKV